MDIVAKRRWFFLISAIIILPGIISLIIPPALNPGIEFTSGTVIDVTFVEGADVNEADIRDELARFGHSESLIQKTGERSVFIRTDVVKSDISAEDGAPPSEQELIRAALTDRIGRVQFWEFDTVSPIVARETVRNAIIVILLASVFVLFYVTWAFRMIPNPFRYGVAAIVALIHDMLIVIGLFSILGKVLDMEVNSMFIAGVVTVLGYSVNDTIVVFDRIRENVARNVDRPLAGVVNTSILESMARSLNTSSTTLLVLLALLLMGGPTIQGFLLVLAVGVVVGTYSSVCIASQFLVMWDQGEIRKALRYVRLVPQRKGER